MKGFLRRSGLQLLTALSQILILLLCLVVFPNLSNDAHNWAANYFISLAVVTPVFMFFGFELRKRSAAGTTEDLGSHNFKRIRGTLYAVLVCAAVCVPTLYLGLLESLEIYAAVVIFRVGTAINDQITANYEARDRFFLSLYSSLAKTVLFATVSVAVGFAWGPTAGMISGSLTFGVVWVLADRRQLVEFFEWKSDRTKLNNLDDVLTGAGAFLVALTISLPRLVAAAVFGEHILNMIGIGQSLNRVGQVLSGSLTQTMIAVRKKSISVRGTESRVTFTAQLIIFLVMICLIPLWRLLFPYADGEMFVWVVGAIFFFGLLSQVNFVLQSIRLLRGGGKDYFKSPVTFLILFCGLTSIFWGLDRLEIATLIGIMLFSRTVQILLNLRAVTGDPAN